MLQGLLPVATELFVGGVAIPFIVWTITSIYSMRQEVALLKQDLAQNREIFNLLKERLN